MSGMDHSRCDHAWKPVRCDRCGREYVCTPADDFYCAAEGDHCCETCLLAGRTLMVVHQADVFCLTCGLSMWSDRAGGWHHTEPPCVDPRPAVVADASEMRGGAS